VRVLIQQCTSAQLRLPTGEVAKIGPGMVVFVCFSKTAQLEDATKAAKTVMKVKLCEVEEEAKRKNLFDSGGELLIIPQATLGGKLKGNSLQYHNNIQPQQGRDLYERFCEEIESAASVPEIPIRRGVYGARQVLSMDTNGPYSHCLDV